MQLLERTQELLNCSVDAGMSLREIANAAGDPVNFEWLRKFRAGKIDNPGVNTIQHLHDALKTLRPRSNA